MEKKTQTDSPETSSESNADDCIDYVAIADEFAAEAVADTNHVRHCHWLRLAASRYLKDRARASQKVAPFYFDDDAANDACDFIEKLPHVEGRWDTETIVLHPAHVFFVVNVFGFRSNDGNRRFSNALLCIARKNAKSTLAAAILLYCLSCEGEPGAQVISAATTGGQARIVFKIAKAMVESTPDLREAFALEPFANSIVNWDDGSNFRPINSKASTQDGLNPSHTCLDEIHAHKTADLLNVLKSAAGARSNVLWLYTTTEGYESPGPWAELRKFCEQVLAGIVDADHFFGCIFALDDQIGNEGDADYVPADDDFDETKWIKANPLIDVNPVLQKEIAKLALEAKQMPSAHGEFKIKRLNRKATAENAWLQVQRWKLCATPVDLVKMEGNKCFAGLDGASTTDLMAFRLVWVMGQDVYTWGMRWVPADSVSNRKERGTVPYDGWVRAGYLKEVPGHTLDYAVIEDDIVGLINRFKPESIGYDPWNLRDLITRLRKTFPDTHGPDGKPRSRFQEFRQGARSFHPAMKHAEKLYMDGKLHHAGDPVLNWCASNVVPRRDENMNMAPDRKRSADKIDDAVAMFMAIGQMINETTEEKAYQMMIL